MEEILKFGVQIAKLKSKDEIKNGAKVQGSIYSLSRGLSYDNFKTSGTKT